MPRTKRNHEVNNDALVPIGVRVKLSLLRDQIFFSNLLTSPSFVVLRLLLAFLLISVDDQGFGDSSVHWNKASYAAFIALNRSRKKGPHRAMSSPPNDFDPQGGASASTSASASLQTVAVRFQERALQLAREQKVLENIQQHLDHLKQTEEHQKREHAKLRREFLSARFERDATEVEALTLQEKADTLRREIQDLKEQVEELRQDAERLENEDAASSIIENTHIIPHRARRALYLDYLHGRVAAAEQKEKNREEKRQKLGELIGVLREEHKEIELHKNDLHKQAEELRDATNRETAEAHAIADKVRAALAERQQLREDLRRTKA